MNEGICQLVLCWHSVEWLWLRAVNNKLDVTASHHKAHKKFLALFCEVGLGKAWAWAWAWVRVLVGNCSLELGPFSTSEKGTWTELFLLSYTYFSCTLFCVFSLTWLLAIVTGKLCACANAIRKGAGQLGGWQQEKLKNRAKMQENIVWKVGPDGWILHSTPLRVECPAHSRGGDGSVNEGSPTFPSLSLGVLWVLLAFSYHFPGPSSAFGKWEASPAGCQVLRIAAWEST